MLPCRAAVILVLTAAVAASQEPSAKDLRTLLHADVKSYAHDGRLIASWSLRKKEELNAFKNQDPALMKVVAGEGLSLEADDKGRAMIFFRELEFRQPCTLTFELKVEAQASFSAQLVDAERPNVRVVAAARFPMGAAEYDFVGRMENGQAAGRPSSSASIVAPGQWMPAILAFKGDRVTLTIGKTEQASLAAADLKRFWPAFASARGKCMLRNLAIDSQVDRDSVRKLFRSVTASTASRPKGPTTSLAHATAWSMLDDECGPTSLGEAESALVAALPSDARAHVEEGLECIVTHGAKRALECFEQALTTAPGSAVVLWLAGVAASDGRLGDKATEYLEKSVAADVKLGRAWLALGKARAERDEDDKAIRAFEHAESLCPEDPWVHVERARLHLERARLPDARRDVDKALVKRPDSSGLKLLRRSLERLSARPDWKQSFKKENSWFVVETSISSKLAADLAQKLVVYRRHLEKAMPLPLTPGIPPSRVWIFDSEEEYHAFASTIASGMDQSVGLYNPLIKTLLLSSKVSADTTQHILFHEAFHQYLDLAVARAPIWMNEGLAEYWGATTFDASGRAAEGGIVSNRLPALRGALVPLAQLMLMSQPAFMHPNGVGLHYAQSWAVVHFFKQGGNPKYAVLFDHYCAAVIAGKGQAEAYAFAFEKDGAPGIDAVEADFRRYVSERLLRGR